MTLIQYSMLLSVLILFLGSITLFSIVSYFTSPLTRKWLGQIAYTTWLKIIGLLATIATLGALTYQYVYLTPVCIDCWWQRIFMFPIEIIVLVSLFTKNKANHILTGVMASIGILISTYHYSKHFERYVIGNSALVPCSPLPGEPLCGLAPTVTFGFITIPFMALFVFASIIWLSYLAHKKSQEVTT